MRRTLHILALLLLPAASALAAGPSELTITGRFLYEARGYDINGHTAQVLHKPVRFANVWIFGMLGTRAETYTDRNGYFTATVPHPGTDLLYVRCYTHSGNAHAADPAHMVLACVQDPIPGLPLFTVGSNWAVGVQSYQFQVGLGTHVAGMIPITHASGLKNIGNPFLVFDTIVGAYDYLVNGLNRPMPNRAQLTVLGRWPTPFDNSGTIFAPLSGQALPLHPYLEISWEDGADPTVCLHEAGHAIYEEYLPHPRSPDGKYRKHWWADSDQFPELAWPEGFATWFGCKVASHMGYPHGIYMDSLGTPVGSGGVYLAADVTTRAPYDHPTIPPWRVWGAADEAAIVTGLWGVTSMPAFPLEAQRVIHVLESYVPTPNPSGVVTVVDFWERLRDMTGEPMLDHWRTSFANAGIRFTDDQYEPNDGRLEAWPILTSTLWMDDLTLFSDEGSKAVDEDAFRIDLDEGQVVSAETRYWTQMADAETMLSCVCVPYGPGGSGVYGDIVKLPGRNYRTIFTAPAKGTYRVHVVSQNHTWSTRRHGSYDLLVKTSSGARLVPEGTLATSPTARIGWTAELELETSIGSEYALYASPTPLDDGVDIGFEALLNLDLGTSFEAAAGSLQGSTTSIYVPVPNDPGLVGQSLYLQAAILDSGGDVVGLTNLQRIRFVE